jgi:hypothetical protein
LKGNTADFLLEYEFKDDDDGFFYDEEPKMIKNETYGTTKYMNHNTIVNHMDLVMPFTSESFEVSYVRNKDTYRVWVISPQRDKKQESLPERITDRQDELMWVLRK